MSTTPAQQVKEFLAQRSNTQPQDWHLVSKARYGMQEVFNTIKEQYGPSTVLTQLFTCATAVNPIIQSGLTPIYSPITAQNISLDPHALAAEASARALVMQHTFGVIDDESAQTLVAKAHERGILVVEDSAHCVGRFARAQDGSILADISIHSFGAEKMLPTKFGGAVWINPQSQVLNQNEIASVLRGKLTNLPQLSKKTSFAMKNYLNQLRILNRLGSVGAKLKVSLANAGWFEPPIAPVESQGKHPYAPAAMPDFVAGQVVNALQHLDAIEQKRAAAVAVYASELEGVVEIPSAVFKSVQTGAYSFVRFPIFVEQGTDAEAIFAQLNSAGVRPGRWYRPALFPGPQDNNAYSYVQGAPEHDVTESLMARVLNLPTDVTVEQAKKNAHTLKSILGK